MDENLIIGEELLDYMSALMEVAQTLNGAQSTVATIIETFGGTDVYEGEARSPIKTYFTSLEDHLTKLGQFYLKAASYAYATYESMYQSDEAMAAWILKQTGQG